MPDVNARLENIAIAQGVALADHEGKVFGVKQTNDIPHALISGADGTVAGVVTGESGDIALAVHIEHLHQSPLFHPFTLDDATGVDTLNGAVSAGAKTLILNDATGFSAGDIVDISSGAVHVHMYRKVASVVTNTLTICSGVDVDLADGSTIQKVSLNMGVNGSVTPVVFEMTPTPDEKVDIMRLLVSIADATEPDDGKFGGGTALACGVHIRKNINNGASYQTIAIWRTNGDMKLDMFNVDYAQKAGGGNWGVNGRWTIRESGAVINLDASNNEKLECVIQDDLTGLVSFQIKIQGHIEV